MPVEGGSVLDLPFAWVQVHQAAAEVRANPLASPPPPGTFRFVATGE